jgi:hypothetical protein
MTESIFLTVFTNCLHISKHFIVAENSGSTLRMLVKEISDILGGYTKQLK